MPLQPFFVSDERFQFPDGSPVPESLPGDVEYLLFYGSRLAALFDDPDACRAVALKEGPVQIAVDTTRDAACGVVSNDALSWRRLFAALEEVAGHDR